jgi:glycosyltransferase involved in cell wall biosynthesis
VSNKRSMAIVRAKKPNLAELCVYRPFLKDFDLTFFFSGWQFEDCRSQLDAIGLQEMKLVRYRSVSELVPSALAQRALDYKVGVGTYMLNHLSDVLHHDYINVVDPIYGFTHQISSSISPGQKLIVVRWDNIYGTDDGVWMAAWRADRVLARADVVVCVSQAAAATLRLPDDFAGKTIQIYPGIDMSVIRSNGSQSGATNGRSSAENLRPVLLFVGRLQWTKGLQILLVALRILREQWHVEPDLWVIGGGNEGSFEGLADELGVRERVRFFGTVSNTEVDQKMAAADIFCFPSLLNPRWMEQFGFAVVEAMAHGLPVVTFDSGSIREVCGEDAYYAATGNPHSLAEQIAKIVENKAQSMARGEKLRQRAFLHFDADQQGKRMLEALERIS